ncbi:hypothetical protein BDV59DRAFT_204925 [Aspergillus ambiguus]|uniref:putative GPI anchored protein n=1 Tax=Aspergillus ambiguus TaxID=176160 RepID=UPI003CCCD302
MFVHRALAFLVASATLYQQSVAQESRRLPGIVDRNLSPLEAAALNKRSVCSDGSQCFIGECCGTGCASNCCGHDNGGVGCGIAEECNFEGNVFIGCCPIGYIGGCTGTATRVTINTPYSTITFGAKTTAEATATATTEQSFSLPTAGSSTRTTAKVASSTTSSGPEMTSSPTTDIGSDAGSGSGSSTGMASSAGMATTTSEGVAPFITAFVPREMNIGAMAMLGAWMAL